MLLVIVVVLAGITVWVVQIVEFAGVIFPVFVQGVFEGLGVLCVDYILWQLIPNGGYSESEEVLPDI